MTRWVSDRQLRESASIDPYAGTVAPNGKLVVSPEGAGFNLSRTNQEWYIDNYGELDDGVLNFGFWDLQSLSTSYYVTPDGSIGFAEANPDTFVAFSEQQMALGRNSIGLWDDLIAISFQETPIGEADITFGNTDDGPFTGAYAYLPFGDGLDALYNAFYGFEQVGRLGGDVWINTQETANYQNFAPGYYATQAITHEIGHALGLSHAGQYNATNPDGSPNSPDYVGDAYFYQDSQQYTIMSYFGGEDTGAQYVDWSTLTYGYPSTPMVHDIVAVQQIYGADMTTRAGDTTYGFNSNADRSAFDLTQSFIPIFTIWDGGGYDTLDLSGYNTPSIIDINPGAFSSAGGTESAEFTRAEVDANRAALGRAPVSDATWAFYEEFRDAYNITSGLLKDNIAVAYNVTIEKAVGGGGDDLIIGNDVSNVLIGNGGDDRLIGGDGVDVLTGGAGDDVVVAQVNDSKLASKVGALSVDIITDFDGSGNDVIDLTGLDQAFHFVGKSSGNHAGDVSWKSYGNVNAAENVLGIDIDGVTGVGNAAGKVTVVFVNTDGGAPDHAFVLLHTSDVSADDFLMAAAAPANIAGSVMTGNEYMIAA